MTKFLSLTNKIVFTDEIEFDEKIFYGIDDNHKVGVVCSNCFLEIGHPTVLRETNYECPRCGFKYKKENNK